MILLTMLLLVPVPLCMCDTLVLQPMRQVMIMIGSHADGPLVADATSPISAECGRVSQSCGCDISGAHIQTSPHPAKQLGVGNNMRDDGYISTGRSRSQDGGA